MGPLLSLSSQPCDSMPGLGPLFNKDTFILVRRSFNMVSYARLQCRKDFNSLYLVKTILDPGAI